MSSVAAGIADDGDHARVTEVRLTPPCGDSALAQREVAFGVSGEQRA